MEIERLCNGSSCSHIQPLVTQRYSASERTLLHHLAGPANNTDDVKVVKLLLKKRADLSAQDNDGLTPIMIAAIGNNQVPNVRILKNLLKREEIPNIEKIKALEVAAAVLLSYYESNAHLLKKALSLLTRAQSLRDRENLHIFQSPMNGLLPYEWITDGTYIYKP